MMTLRQIVNAQRGFFDVEEKRNRHHYEVARLLAGFIAAPHLKKGASFELTFPWEESPRPKLTKEQIEHLSAQIDKAVEKAEWRQVDNLSEIKSI